MKISTEHFNVFNNLNSQVTVNCIKGAAVAGTFAFINYGKCILEYSINLGSIDLGPRILEKSIVLTAGLSCFGILMSYCGKYFMEYINERDWAYISIANAMSSLSCFVHKMGLLMAVISGIITTLLVFINCIG